TVALFNLDSATADVTATLSDLGIKGKVTARDVWGKKNLGVISGSYTASLAGHASLLLTVRPQQQDR
ncbi:MAG: hypothetical protein QOE89_3236, partial [Pseudonocardiales bacterium]|nr:hypothetical protein [Pseudonocardiales bacterium]